MATRANVPYAERFPLGLGLLAAVCFSLTFVVNRSIALDSGYWAWSASLRYFLTLPILIAIVSYQGLLGVLRRSLLDVPKVWVVWGTVGFVLFYGPLAAAAAFAPAWVVAGTWPVTIVMGIFMAPFIYDDERRFIDPKALTASFVVLVGVALLQLEHARKAESEYVVVGLLLVTFAAIAYPLGNRKVMLALETVRYDVRVAVRLAAMTIGSIPAWIAIGTLGYVQSGWPSKSQVASILAVAVCSGVVATSLFFLATDSVRHDGGSLAAVEATQAAELPFTLFLEMLFLGARRPGMVGLAGLFVVVSGMMWHSYKSTRRQFHHRDRRRDRDFLRGPSRADSI